MPRGDKSAYTDKQKRQAQYIEEEYEKRGLPEDEAEGRAWATVNKVSGGGKLSGSGRGGKTDPETSPIGSLAAGARNGSDRAAPADRRRAGGDAFTKMTEGDPARVLRDRSAEPKPASREVREPDDAPARRRSPAPTKAPAARKRIAAPKASVAPKGKATPARGKRGKKQV